jgi:hypothetical protein
MALLNYRIFRLPLMVWVTAFFVAIPFHFLLKYTFSTLFKPKVSDIEMYICCTNIFTETQNIGYGLIILILIGLLVSFYGDKKILNSNKQEVEASTISLNLLYPLIIAISFRILISLWMFKYWTALINDFQARQIITSGNTKIPLYLIYILSLNAVMASFIIIIEPLQNSLVKLLRQTKKGSFLLANDIYILSFVRLIIYIIIFLSFSWIVIFSMI